MSEDHQIIGTQVFRQIFLFMSHIKAQTPQLKILKYRKVILVLVCGNNE